jgi:hypothetical protein
MERVFKMKLRSLIAVCLPFFFTGALATSSPARNSQTAQTQQPPPAKTPASRAEVSRVTIEVSGGDDNAPVENASVYVKYVQERKIFKDKKVELNVKTSRDGTAHVPEAPLGRALIQVVADGWKTYGRWYDITEPKQVIKVHLEKPPRWY